MGIKEIVLLYLVTAIIFFTIDLIWLGVIAKNLYSKHLNAFLSDKVNWSAAALFYLIYIAGILVFAVIPSIDQGSLFKAAVLGCFLGFFAYATFDLTCLALFRDWPKAIVVIDLAWGTFLTGSVSVLTAWSATLLLN